MVSKLAPARFATMMMGFWLIISFFGNFAGVRLVREDGNRKWIGKLE